MILLNTNVVSEAMRPAGAKPVLKWLDEQLAETLYLSSVSLAELLVGLAMLPRGKRKTELDQALTVLSDQLFGSRILTFDLAAAVAYAQLVAGARRLGRTMSMADGQIAAIASVHGFTVATRDTQPFVAAGVPVIDPWNVRL